MALYEYRCEQCDNLFTRMVNFAEHSKGRVSCPKCKSTKVVQLFSAFYAKTIRKS